MNRALNAYFSAVLGGFGVGVVEITHLWFGFVLMIYPKPGRVGAISTASLSVNG